MERAPAFSAILPTYQRRESLRRVLERLGRQAYPTDRLEIIVVCDGCTDGSAEMARSFDARFPLTVLEQPNQGPAVARNQGLAHARGPFVLFVDDDVLPEPSFVAEHAAAHEGREDRVVIGPLMPSPQRHLPWVDWEGRKLVEQYRLIEAGVYKPSPYQFFTGNASVRLDALRRVGGFDPAFRRAEDVELALRLQASRMDFVLAPRAGALHEADRPYASWLRAAYQYGRNDVRLADKGTAHSYKRLADTFEMRHPLMQSAIKTGLRNRRAAAALRTGAGMVARSAAARRIAALGRVACSVAFNFEYWRGVGDELGGESLLRDAIVPWRFRHDAEPRPGEARTTSSC